MRILEKTLLPGSGGAGEFRGGLGQRIAMEVTSSRPVTLAILSQRLNYPPRGRQGGADGSVERILLNGAQVEGGVPFQLHQGDVIVLELPGGGGFGDIRERSAKRIADRPRTRTCLKPRAERSRPDATQWAGATKKAPSPGLYR